MLATTAYRYAERDPSAPFAPWFLRYWLLEPTGPDPVDLVLPTCATTMLLLRLEAGERPILEVLGVRDTPVTLPVGPHTRWFGLRLQFGATRELLGVPPDTIRGTRQYADRYLGAFAHRLATVVADAPTLEAMQAAVESRFFAVMPRLPVPDPLVARVAQMVDDAMGEITPEAIAAEIGTAPRTVTTRFRVATGLTLRQFAKARGEFLPVRRAALA
jgi:AraC-like DNA-binding protein